MELFWKMKTPVRSELKQQGCCKGFVLLGRWRPQQECQKSSTFILAKEELCTCSILLGTFFSFSTTTWNCLVSRFIEKVMGTLSKDDGDSNKNGKKGIGLISKLTTLHVHHITLCVPSLHDYEVRAPNFTFCGGREHKATTSFFFSCTLTQSFRIQLQTNLPTFDELHEME